MELHPDIIIKTDRLLLEPVHEKYIEDIFINFTSEVTFYMPHNPEGNKENVINFVQQSKKGFLEKKEIVFAILDVKKEFLGCCGIHHMDSKKIEIGLWLKTEAQNKGFGTETVSSLVHFIEKNLRFDYLIYPVDKDNTRSRKIAEKAGFIPFLNYTKRKTDLIDLNIVEYRKYYSSSGN